MSMKRLRETTQLSGQSEFDRTVGADAIVLTKADMDSRGGAAISIAHTIGKPLLFLGTGQAYDDIVPFEPEAMVEELLGGGPL